MARVVQDGVRRSLAAAEPVDSSSEGAAPAEGVLEACEGGGRGLNCAKVTGSDTGMALGVYKRFQKSVSN